MVRADDLRGTSIDIRAPPFPRLLGDHHVAFAFHRRIDVIAEFAATDGHRPRSVGGIVCNVINIEPGNVGEIGRGGHVLDLVRNPDAHVARHERARKHMRVLDQPRAVIGDDVAPAIRNRIVFRHDGEADVQHRQHRPREIVDLIEPVSAAPAPDGKRLDHRAEGHRRQHARVFEAVHRGCVRKKRRSDGRDAKGFANRLHRLEECDRREGNSRIVRRDERAV